jgi:prolyl 4-hydroxylase
MHIFTSQLPDPETLIRLGRYSEALLALGQRGARGDPEALFLLAGMKWAGLGGPAEPARGRELYRSADAAGHKIARVFHTNLLASGIAGPRDWPGAIERLRREAAADPARRRALDLIEKMKLTPEGDPAALPEPEVLSTSPEVRGLTRLLTADECQYLRDIAEAGYEPSIVNTSSGGTMRDPIRTSDGSTLHWLIEDPVVHAINRRLAAASGSDFVQGEAMQILRYRPGQEYRPHLDVGSNLDNPRGLTALVYLNHDYQGGETRFVETGLQVAGRKGDALVFRNVTQDGRPDPSSRHAGLPIRRGVKYLASRWIRQQRWTP